MGRDGAETDRREAQPESGGRRGPFSGLDPARRRLLIWVSGAFALALFVVLAVVDGQIKENGGPGIIGLEVAGSAARAATILSDWGASGIDAARVSLILDFPFMLAYAIFFGAACTAIGERLRQAAAGEGPVARVCGHLAPLAGPLGWAFILAALLDLVENLALLRVIEFQYEPWVRLAQLMASPKLAIFGAGIFFLLVSFLLTAKLPRRLPGRPRSVRRRDRSGAA